MRTYKAIAFIGMSVALDLAARAAAPDFTSRFQAVGFSRSAPALSFFSVDSLGQGKVVENPILPPEPIGNTAIKFEADDGTRFTYRLPTANGKLMPVWRVNVREKTLTLRSEYFAGTQSLPFVFCFSQKSNHATLLGLMEPGDRRMSLPCVLHLPDMGSVRITSNVRDAKLGYDARRSVPTPFVRVEFPPATARQGAVEYQLIVTAIYPKIRGIEKNPLYDGVRRGWLNMFQVNPRVQMLANNAASDPCSLTVFVYSEMAASAPPLADGLTCLDLIRMTLDRYLAGAKGYGQVGYACRATDADLIAWKTPWTSLDTLPSLLIAACNYANGAREWNWARANYDKIAMWGREMMEADKDGNGLIEYPGTGNYGDRPLVDRRPSNWWDTINFGHEDAFANALAYRALTAVSELAHKLKHNEDAKWFAEKASKLRSAYVPTFLNPATGVLAGWKSADGQLHDYWFTFVQGAAITYGLVEPPQANQIMDRLLQKMEAVGYTNFFIGLPGNLVPVKKGDYVYHDTPPQVHGVPKLEDGSDGFQYYENGGATACWAYFTIKTLYKLGRVQDARRIYHPMLRSYANGNFQGFCDDGMSKDWRDWRGGCHGYEGLLVDSYHALLAVLDDVKTK